MRERRKSRVQLLTELEIARVKAKDLFVNGGVDAKSISQKVGVSEQTMVKWIAKYDWKNARNEVMEAVLSDSRLMDSPLVGTVYFKKAKARHIFLKTGLPNKEIASIVGVTEQTYCEWIKRGKWRKEREEKSGNPDSPDFEGIVLTSEFVEYAVWSNPSYAGELPALLKKFIKLKS